MAPLSNGAGRDVTAPRITVAVAACGRPEALERCLRALACGKSVPEEVLVVDQDATPASEAMVLAVGPPGTRYLAQERRGVSASRNLALAAAAGTVLAVTDDDCVPDPEWVGALRDAFSRPPLPSVVTGRILPLGEPPPGAYAVSLRESVDPADYRGRTVPWHVGSGGNLAATRELLQRVGGWNECLGPGSGGRAAEDAELLYRLLKSGDLVRYEPAAVVRHEWQLRERRLATRWSYGYGTGALLALQLRRRDAYALKLLGDYVRLQVRGLLSGIKRRDGFRLGEHCRALAGLVPGLRYGMRVPRRYVLQEPPAAG